MGSAESHFNMIIVTSEGQSHVQVNLRQSRSGTDHNFSGSQKRKESWSPSAYQSNALPLGGQTGVPYLFIF